MPSARGGGHTIWRDVIREGDVCVRADDTIDGKNVTALLIVENHEVLSTLQGG